MLAERVFTPLEEGGWPTKSAFKGMRGDGVERAAGVAQAEGAVEVSEAGGASRAVETKGAAGRAQRANVKFRPRRTIEIGRGGRRAVEEEENVLRKEEEKRGLEAGPRRGRSLVEKEARSSSRPPPPRLAHHAAPKMRREPHPIPHPPLACRSFFPSRIHLWLAGRGRLLGKTACRVFGPFSRWFPRCEQPQAARAGAGACRSRGRCKASEGSEQRYRHR